MTRGGEEGKKRRQGEKRERREDKRGEDDEKMKIRCERRESKRRGGSLPETQQNRVVARNTKSTGPEKETLRLWQAGLRWSQAVVR